MKRFGMLKYILPIFLIIFGCSTISPWLRVTIEPQGNGVYMANIMVDRMKNIENQKKELERLGWIRQRVEKNEICPKGYEIIDREVIPIKTGPIQVFSNYYIYYKLSCLKIG